MSKIKRTILHLHQSLQLLCSIDQSHPLLILLDGEIKGMAYPAPGMGVQDREDSDAHLKETFPQPPTPINHEASSGLLLKYILKSVHFSQSFCQLPVQALILYHLNYCNSFLGCAPCRHSCPPTQIPTAE